MNTAIFTEYDVLFHNTYPGGNSDAQKSSFPTLPIWLVKVVIQQVITT